MVIEENIRNKQLKILSILFEVNYEVDNEYEAQKLICDTLLKLKQENNLDNFNITTYITDNLKKPWKHGRGENNKFIKIFYNEIEEVKELYDLKRSEVLFLYSLTPYLLWEENLLVDKEGIPLNQKRLCSELELDRKTIYKNVKSLEQKKCLIRIWDGRDVYYLVNPSLMFKGEKIHRSIPKLFEMIGYKDKSIKTDNPQE
jgi:DNA-binding MarR family transcriptional regulator